MLDTQQPPSTRRLAGDLLSQIADLMSIEGRLIRAELNETSAKVTSAVIILAGGAVFAFGGLCMLMVAAAAALMRLGVAADMACLIVALVGLGVGSIVLLLGARALSSAEWLPTRSLRQLASIIGGR
jgi:Putative Actinobacterial Holin-X, holin superfamily III